MNCKLIKATIVAVAAVLSASCTSQLEDMDLSTIHDASSLTVDSIDYHLDVYQYVQKHKDYFGNVLIFTSMDEVNTLLQNMANMDYTTLRTQYMILQAEFGFKNAIIESNIFYDSIYSTVAQEYGYNLLVENVEIEEEDFYIELEQRLIANNQNLLSVCQKQSLGNIVSVSNETFIEPLGYLDWYALLNEKSIFIAANAVYVLTEDGEWQILPIQEYCDTYKSLRKNNVMDSTAKQSSAVSYGDDRTQRYHTGYNEDYTYMLCAEFITRQTNLYTSQTAYEVSLIITNYKKNGLGNWVKMWSHVDGSFSCRVRCVTNQILSSFWSGNFDGTYIKGSETYYKIFYLGEEPLIVISQLYPYDIHINISNWKGCQISY